MVKIESTSLSRSTALSKSKKANSPGTSFSNTFVGGAKTSQTEGKMDADKIAGIQAPEGIFQIQEISDALGSRRKTMERGETLLNGLDLLKIQLLGGRVSKSSLEQLKKLLDDQHAHSIDIELESVLKEIELRVQVELAKLEQTETN